MPHVAVILLDVCAVALVAWLQRWPIAAAISASSIIGVAIALVWLASWSATK